MAFDAVVFSATSSGMGKHRSFIRNWRTFRGLKQREVIERLADIKEQGRSRESFPTTEASLSRIEAGDQNFNMAFLTALAEVLGADDPRDLLTVNPFKGTLSVLRELERLTPVQQEAALTVINAMRASGASPAPGETADE